MGSAKVAVLGIGNTILGDDGAGAHLARRLGENWSFSPAVDIHLVETGGLHAADLMNGYETVILLDTALGNEQLPGAVFILDKADLLCPASISGLAGHALGLRKAIEFAEVTGAMPRQLFLVAIVPEVIAFSEELSEQVQAAMPDYERKTLVLLHTLGIDAINNRGAFAYGAE